MASKRFEREEAQQAEAASKNLEQTPGRAGVADELLDKDAVEAADNLDALEDEEEAAAEDAATAGA
jgi:hypothetical protein